MLFLPKMLVLEVFFVRDARIRDTAAAGVKNTGSISVLKDLGIY